MTYEGVGACFQLTHESQSDWMLEEPMAQHFTYQMADALAVSELTQSFNGI